MTGGEHCVERGAAPFWRAAVLSHPTMAIYPAAEEAGRGTDRQTGRQTDRQNFGHTNCGCIDGATVYGSRGPALSPWGGRTPLPGGGLKLPTSRDPPPSNDQQQLGGLGPPPSDNLPRCAATCGRSHHAVTSGTVVLTPGIDRLTPYDHHVTAAVHIRAPRRHPVAGRAQPAD